MEIGSARAVMYTVFTLNTHTVYILFVSWKICFWSYNLNKHAHTFSTLSINTSTHMGSPGDDIRRVCVPVIEKAGDACLKIRVPVTSECAEAWFTPLPVYHHTCTHGGAAFVYWLGLIIATLETVYLVRHPITLPNVCSSLRGWNEVGPGMFHTLLKHNNL